MFIRFEIFKFLFDKVLIIFFLMLFEFVEVSCLIFMKVVFVFNLFKDFFKYLMYNIKF